MMNDMTALVYTIEIYRYVNAMMTNNYLVIVFNYNNNDNKNGNNNVNNDNNND